MLDILQNCLPPHSCSNMVVTCIDNRRKQKLWAGVMGRWANGDRAGAICFVLIIEISILWKNAGQDKIGSQGQIMVQKICLSFYRNFEHMLPCRWLYLRPMPRVQHVSIESSDSECVLAGVKESGVVRRKPCRGGLCNGVSPTLYLSVHIKPVCMNQ